MPTNIKKGSVLIPAVANLQLINRSGLFILFFSIDFSYFFTIIYQISYIAAYSTIPLIIIRISYQNQCIIFNPIYLKEATYILFPYLHNWYKFIINSRSINITGNSHAAINMHGLTKLFSSMNDILFRLRSLLPLAVCESECQSSF